VCPSPRVDVPFNQSKVNDVDYVLLFLDPNQKVIGFDIPVNETLLVQLLYPIDALEGDHSYGF
jgi:hypothetical protein